MGRHSFNFDGGDELTTMGASWFVSYSYYRLIDNRHDNWRTVKTAGNRASVYERTKYLHKFWLTKILEMEDSKLNKNSLKLSAFQIKQMANQLLPKVR